MRRFLPRRCFSTVYAVVMCLSVSASVCHTSVLYGSTKTAEPRITQSHTMAFRRRHNIMTFFHTFATDVCHSANVYTVSQ